ncbi:MAG: 4-hydroxy-3-methylbut-2-enyl diphosphate reductase, partial [Syntrophales bacterium]|nr:4-hydroxy-3-methylbut-2-enyl diphosphate reductase [Syntrophales bacterium]
TAGFCMGVKRAVDLVLDVARSRGRGKIYTYGHLIHNPQTVELLKKREIIPIEDIDEIPAGEEGAVLVVRTHGISPEQRRRIKEKGIKILDATCPKVAHVQAVIKKHVVRGYTIIIAGDEGHPEVTGLLGYAAGRGIVVGSKADAEKLPPLDKVGIVAQTTQDIDLYGEIVNAVKERFPQAVVFDTICDSTEKRQKEVRDLAARMEAMVIVGGRNSANTRRLAEISAHQGTPTLYIETAEELKNHPLCRYNRIGVSAGASTPNWIIDRVVNNITSYQAPGGKRAKSLFMLWLFLVRTDIYVSAGAGCLYLAGALIQKFDLHLPYFLIAALYVYAMHILNRFMDKKAGIIGSFREETYLEREFLFIPLAITALISALILAIAQGIRPFLLLFLISFLGILYNANVLPQGRHFRSLRELPGSKNVSMAMAWAMVTAVLPGLGVGFSVSAGMVVAFLFVFTVVFIRSVMSDILDIQNDRLIGRETIPVIAGRENAQKILKAIWALLFALLALSFPAGWSTSVVLALLTCLFYILISFKLCDRRAALPGIVLAGLLETNYIIAGISALLWLIFIGRGI